MCWADWSEIQLNKSLCLSVHPYKHWKLFVSCSDLVSKLVNRQKYNMWLDVLHFLNETKKEPTCSTCIKFHCPLVSKREKIMYNCLFAFTKTLDFPICNIFWSDKQDWCDALFAFIGKVSVSYQFLFQT